VRFHRNPHETNAVNKLQDDFLKINNGWNEISKIKEYYFVLNDKYMGSYRSLEGMVSSLSLKYPNINFNLLLAKDLEKIFFQLVGSDMLELNFNIDIRQAISIAYSYLESVKTELDKENLKFAQIYLENVKEIISELSRCS
jgi:hypothetical protein